MNCQPIIKWFEGRNDYGEIITDTRIKQGKLIFKCFSGGDFLIVAKKKPMCADHKVFLSFHSKSFSVFFRSFYF